MELLEKPDLSHLAQDAAQTEGASTFMEPGRKRKNKPGAGRPKGSTKSAQPGPAQASPGPETPPIPTKDIVRPVVTIMSAWSARLIRDEKAQMTLEESEAIVTSGSMVLDKWAPYLMGNFGPEIMFLSVMSMWGTRVYAIHTVNEQARRERDRRQPTQPNGADSKPARESRHDPVEQVIDFGGQPTN